MMTDMENWKSPCVVDIACPIVVWLRDTFVADSNGRVPKDEVYRLYQAHCKAKGWTPKRNSDFGKVIKKAFPDINSRRLGSAGKQVSHYAGIAIRDAQQPQQPSPSSPTRSAQPRSPKKTQTSPTRKKCTQQPSDTSSSIDMDMDVYNSPSRSSKRNRGQKRKCSDDEEREELVMGDDEREDSDSNDATYEDSPRKAPRSTSNSPRMIVKKEKEPFILPPSLRAPPNIVIHNTVNVTQPITTNPHSSTDAFFSSSGSMTVTVNNKASHPTRTEHHTPEDYTTGNDQSPITRKPRHQMDLMPLMPDYAAEEAARDKRHSDLSPFGSEGMVLEDEHPTDFGVPLPADARSLPFALSPTMHLDPQIMGVLPPNLGGITDRFIVDHGLSMFGSVIWPLIPLPATIMNEISINWFLKEGQFKNSRLSFFTYLALYYTSVVEENLAQAKEFFSVLITNAVDFYDEEDTTVALALAMLSTCTYSWYEPEEALNRSRELMAQAMKICENMGETSTEIYHMCLDMRSWLEGGRLSPSLHARFTLHSNGYPPFLLPCRVAIKQCHHLVTMVRHIVFILEHAPRGTVLPPSARADVDEKLVLLKVCYSNMSSSSMEGHPFIAHYLRVLLVGATAEMRLALGERDKALTKAILFVDLCKDMFPFVDVVFYAERVFDILINARLYEHAKRLTLLFKAKYAPLKNVEAFLISTAKKLEQEKVEADSLDNPQSFLSC